jgi:polar amino acid transport system substrate-binding protein
MDGSIGLKRVALIAVTITVLSLFSGITNALPLRIAQSEWAPYVMDSPIGRGIAHDIVMQGLSNSGYQFVYEQKPWPRVLKETFYGKNDVIIAIWKSDERERHYYFTEPYLNNTLTVISRVSKTPFEYEDLTSLNDKRVALIEDYAYPSELLAHNKMLPIPSDSLSTSLRMVLSNRADVLITDEFVARWMIKEMNLSINKFQFSAEPFSFTPLHVAVRKDHPYAQQIVYNLNYYFRNLSRLHIELLKIKYGLALSGQ